MNSTTGVIVLVASLTFVAGCSTDLRCGDGTLDEDGICILQCQAGERLDPESQSCVGVCSEGTIYNEDTGMCEPEAICGAGTHLVDSQCLPDTSVECGSGTSYDDDSGRCVPDCVEGTHRDEATGACMPNSAACITGQVWDANSGHCVDVAGYCGEGTTWVASESTCIPDDDLLDADYVEGTGENDPNFGGEGAFESFDVPEVGSYIIVGGTIEAAEDKDDDGDLDPDYDYFVFSIDHPTLLRITADGVGGASSGFMVTAMDSDRDFQRFGIGTTSDGALRDVFLPLPGEYSLVASDAMNFLAGSPGPFFGGDGLGYFITIEQLPVPSPEALLWEGSTLDINSTWPNAPPEHGSMLGFFSVDVSILPESLGSLFAFDLVTDDLAVDPMLVMLGEDDALLSNVSSPSSIRAFEDEVTLMLVADYVYWFGFTEAAYTMRVEDLEMESIVGSLDVTSVYQPTWVPGDGRLPYAYFGFSAASGTVVTLHSTTTTGETAFEVSDSTLETSYGWFQGRETSPQYEGDIRFFCQVDGLYILKVLDMSGALGVFENPEYIESNRYSITTDIREQLPLEIGGIDGEWSTEGPEAVSVEEWERFFLFEPSVGQSVLFDIMPFEAFNPTVSFYSILDEGPLRSHIQRTHLGEPFPKRFPENESVLFGVADASFSAGVFELQMSSLEVSNLGPLSSGAPIEVSEITFAPVLSTNIFQIDPSEPGLVALEVTPSGDDDIELIARDSLLEEIGRINVGEGGASEAIEFLVTGTEPAFFEVIVASREPLPSITISAELELDAFEVEEEPNDSPIIAHSIDLPATLAGALLTPDDQDWFTFDVSGAATLVAETLGTGASSTIDTHLVLLDGDGTTELAGDDDSGNGTLSRLISSLEDSGTFFIVVEHGQNENGGDYFLSVEATLQ